LPGLDLSRKISGPEEGRRSRWTRWAFEPGQDETPDFDLGLLFDTSQHDRRPRLSREAVVASWTPFPGPRAVHHLLAEDIHVPRYDSENQQGLIERIQGVQAEHGPHDAIAVYLSRVQDNPGEVPVPSPTARIPQSPQHGRGRQLVRSSSVVIYPISFAAISR
jgi:hypothetical protein